MFDIVSHQWLMLNAMKDAPFDDLLFKGIVDLLLKIVMCDECIMLSL